MIIKCLEFIKRLVDKCISDGLKDIRIKDTIITYSEQLELITFMNNVDFKDTSQIVNKIDMLPESIKSVVIKKLDFNRVKYYSIIIWKKLTLLQL